MKPAPNTTLSGLKLLSQLVKLPLLLKEPLVFLISLHERFGDVILVRLGFGRRLFLIQDPNHILHVLSNTHKKYRKFRLYRLKDMGFGNGLISAESNSWIQQRRLLQPYFKTQMLAKFSPVIIDAVTKKLQTWETENSIDIENEMLDISHEVIVRALVTEDISGMVRKVRNLFLETTDVSLLSGAITTPGSRRRLEDGYRELDELIWKIIRKRKRDSKTYDDLLNAFLHASDRKTGFRMSDELIHNEIVTLLFTGDETVAQTLTFAWYLLARNPETEIIFHQELKSILGGRTPTIEALPELRYTRWIIDETLRLYPPAWAISRIAVENDRIGTLRVPKNSILVFSQYIVQRDERFWPNPGRFLPERFDGVRGRTTAESAYFPFGTGARRCIGQELAYLEAVLVLAAIGQWYRLRLDPGYELKIKAGVTLRPDGGLPMRPVKIQKTRHARSPDET